MGKVTHILIILIGISLLNVSPASAEIGNGEEYVSTLQELFKTPDSNPPKQIRLAAELEAFNLAEMNNGLSVDERIALAKKVDRILSSRKLSNRQRIFAVRAAEGLLPAGSRLGEEATPVRRSLITRMRAYVSDQLPGAFGKQLREQSITSIGKMGEVAIPSAQTYVDRLQELSRLYPVGKPALQPFRRESLLQAFDAAGTRPLRESLTISQRQELATSLGGLLTHNNGDVQRIAIQSYGELMGTEVRGRAQIDPSSLDTLRQYANSKKVSAIAEVRGREATAALEKIGEPADAGPYVRKLFEAYNAQGTERQNPLLTELQQMDLGALVKHMSRESRVGMVGELTVLLQSQADRDFHSQAIRAVRILIPENPTGRMSTEEQKVRGELLAALQALIPSDSQAPSHGVAIAQGKFRAQVTHAIEALGVRDGVHKLETFVSKLEQMVEANATNHARLNQEVRGIELFHETSELEHRERFELARRVLDVIENPKSSPSTKELGLTVLPALIGRFHVKRVESTHQTIHTRALSLTQENMRSAKTGSTIRGLSITAHVSLGGIPIYDAETYVSAVVEFAELTPPGEPSPDTAKRQKIYKTLRSVNPSELINGLGLQKRKELVALLDGVLEHHNADVRTFAMRGIGDLGARGGKRRTDVIPAATVEKLQAAASMDAKNAGDVQSRAEANMSLEKIGLEIKLVIRTATEFANAVSDFSKLEGRISERATVLRDALTAFDFSVLPGRMSGTDRAYAVRALEQVLDLTVNGECIKSREWAIQGLGKLLETQGHRMAVADWNLVHRVQQKLWNLVPRKTKENIHDRRFRARAIESLESMGEHIIVSPQVYIDNLETAVRLWNEGGRSAERSAAERAMDHFNLEMAQPQITPLMRRELSQRVGALVVDAGNREEGRIRAIHTFGNLMLAERRSGAGIPREALLTLRALAIAPRQEVSRELQTAASVALGKMGVPEQGEFSSRLEMELYDPRPQVDLGSIIERLGNHRGEIRLEAARDLEGWSEVQLKPLVWGGQHRDFPDVLARCLADGDLRVRTVILQQLSRWAQEGVRPPGWITTKPILRNAVVSNLSTEHGGVRFLAADLLGNHLAGTGNTESAQFVQALVDLIRLADSSEESRLVAARTLAKSKYDKPGKIAGGLIIAFGRAGESSKAELAGLVDSYRRKSNHRVKSAVYLASRWMISSGTQEELLSKITESLQRNEPAQVAFALSALHWLSAEATTGRPNWIASNKTASHFQVPPWLNESNSVTATLIGLLNSDDPEVRSRASNLFTSRGIAQNLVIDDAVINAAQSAVANGRKHPEETLIAAQILRRSNRTEMNADAYLQLVQTPTKVLPQFHPETIEIILDRFRFVEAVDFTGCKVTRQEFVDQIMQNLGSEIPEVKILAARAAGVVVPRKGTKYADVTPESMDELTDLLRARVADPTEDPMVIAAAGDTIVNRMKRKLKVKIMGGTAPVQRVPLIHILNDLLVENERLQLQAAEDLAMWRPSQNGGREVLTEQLKRWKESGGPNFGDILSQIVLKKHGDSLEVRRAVMEALRQLVQRAGKSVHFEPGLMESEEIHRLVDLCLSDSDPEIRRAAEILDRGLKITRSRERQPLLQVLSDLLAESEPIRLQAAEDLARWSPAQNNKQEVLTEQLEHWRRFGGPNFDKIISEIMRGEHEASLELRRAVMRALRELGQRGTRKAGFEPGLQEAAEIQRTIALLLHDPDPEIRAEAEVLARRRFSPSNVDSIPADRTFEHMVAEGLKDPNRQIRTLNLLEFFVTNGKGYRVPQWLGESVEIQMLLVNLLLSKDADVRRQATHQLTYRLKSVRKPLEDHEIRKLGEAGVEKRDDRLKEVVPSLLHVMHTGSDEAQVVAINYLSTMGVVDPRIVPELVKIAIGDPNPAVRAEAIRALGFRNIEAELVYRSPELFKHLEWLWNNFKTNSDPEIRRESIGVIFAHADLIRRLPDKIFPPGADWAKDEQVYTIVHTIKLEMGDIERCSEYPVDADIIRASKLARTELALRKERGKALEVFEESESTRTFPNDAPEGETGRDSLRAFVQSCAPGGFLSKK